MDLNQTCLPSEWEEKWRREKEHLKRIVQEGGEEVERNKQELRRIVAYNDSKMGLSNARTKQLNTDAFVSKGLNYTIIKHPYDIFQSLSNFWRTGILTDLILVLDNGHSYQVHTSVLAAISLFVRNRLLQQKAMGCWSLNLGFGVDNIGLQAVLEFAYTGAIRSVQEGDMGSVISAAKSMESPRMLEIYCKRTEKSGTEDRNRAADELQKTLEEIHRMRSEQVGCDVVLDVTGVLFHVHKVILAACSDFFRGMFTSGMKESSQSNITLPFLFAPELQALIECSYTGHLHLNWDCVFEITCTSLQLQFSHVLPLCFKFMLEQMDSYSCLDVISFAEAYEMTELLDEANDFVLRNFWQVSETAKFLDLPAEKLADFLKNDGLCAPSELAVFRAAISWIEADSEVRLNQASLLMSSVRFPLMTFREFREVRAINLRMECGEYGEEVELYSSAFKEFGNLDTETKCRVRKPKNALVIVGGDQLYPDMGQRIPSREVWFANCLRSGTGLVKNIEWRKLGEIPDQPKFRHGVAVLEGGLYVIGGCYFYTKDDIMKSAYRYDPGLNSWRRLSDMNEFRSNFSLIAN
ncbi:unnamed protein product [Knipowitschia caucasica]